MDFVVPADPRVKLKECEKRDKYLDLARESKKLLYMKVTIILIVIGDLGTVTKGLVQGLEELEITGGVETSKLQHFWYRPEYWEESWRLKETCYHSNSIVDFEKLTRNKMIIIVIVNLKETVRWEENVIRRM